jgi:hypothetical protein
MIRILILLVAALVAAPLGAAPLVYSVQINTSGASGAAALLNLQFNPGSLGSADSAQVDITGFATDGTLGVLDSTQGGVSGTLPATVTLANSSDFNDYLQNIVLGSYIRFAVVFSGAGVESPTGQLFGSTFAVSLYDAGLTGSVLPTSDENLTLATIDVPVEGGVSDPVVSSELTSVSQVPEPATGVLAGAGLGLALLLKRRR